MKKKLYILLLVIIFGTLTVNANNTGGFELKPAYPNNIKPASFSFEIKPGSSAEDTIEISNTSKYEITIDLYATDSYKNEKDQTQYKLHTAEQETFGKWVTFDQNKIKLQPGETTKVKFTINIPENQKKGDYIGGIAGEAKGTKSIKDKNQNNISINIRTIKNAYLKVTDNPQPIEKYHPPFPWAQVYFWSSLIIFVIAIGVYGGLALKKHLKKRKHETKKTATSLPKPHSHEPSPAEHHSKEKKT